jgi:hypothetical protein
MSKIFPLLLLLFYPFIVAGQQSDHVKGEIIVKLTAKGDVYTVVKDFQRFENIFTRLRVIIEVSAPMRAWLLAYESDRVDEQKLLSAIRTHASVELAQFNHYLRMRETIPDDTHFASQWQWKNTGQNEGTPDADIDAELAWDITTGGLTSAGDTIVVCVVEGANRNHEDLQGNLWYNWQEIPGNGIDDDANGFTDDFNGWNILSKADNITPQSHGTAVSGLIGAKGNNEKFTTGLNWNVKLMHVDFAGITEANAMSAFTYPWVMRRIYNETKGQRGAFVVVVNSSWGLDNKTASSVPLWCAFYDSLGVAGILSCGATTNNNVDVDKVGDIPSSCESEFLIAITATNKSDERTFSGFGKRDVDVAAPGANVASLTLNGAPSNSTGTSFAAPIVSGLIALLYSAPCGYISELARKEPSLAALYVRDAVFNGVDTLASLRQIIKYSGRVNAFNSLRYILFGCGPCPKPLGITARDLTDRQVSLSWVSSDSSTNNKLRYREVGDSTWTVRDSVKSKFLLKALSSCSVYEAQILSTCNDLVSDYSNSLIFKTDGCCEPPVGLKILSLKDTAAYLGWQAVLAANSYKLLLKGPDSASLVKDLQKPGFSLEGLSPCTQYSVQVQTVCDTGLTVFTSPVSFRTFGCGPCLDSVYCSSRSENASQEWIKSVQLNNLDNTSGSDNGYGDYTGKELTLSTYKSYPLSLTPGYESAALTEWFVVWIDFNQDGDFLDADEEVFSSGLTNKRVSGTVIIPGAAKAGVTRMRVSMRWNQKPSPCTPVYNFGEVEDYCLTIVPGVRPTCQRPDSLEINQVSFDSATVNWKNNEQAFLYEIRYRPKSDTNWVVMKQSATSARLLSLKACTDYVIQVRGNCVDVLGNWSDSFEFKTACYPSCDSIPSGLDTLSIGDSSAVVSWRSLSSAQFYRLNYKLSTDTSWKTIETNNLVTKLTNLKPCASYQVTIQAACLGGSYSQRSKPLEFITSCLNNVNHELVDMPGLKISPNPFSEELSVKFESIVDGIYTISLFTAQGRKIFLISVLVGKGMMLKLPAGPETELSRLPVGVYFLKIESGSFTKTIRLVKQ